MNFLKTLVSRLKLPTEADAQGYVPPAGDGANGVGMSIEELRTSTTKLVPLVRLESTFDSTSTVSFRLTMPEAMAAAYVNLAYGRSVDFSDLIVKTLASHFRTINQLTEKNMQLTKQNGVLTTEIERLNSAEHLDKMTDLVIACRKKT